jgi:hypothetical protein
MATPASSREWQERINSLRYEFQGRGKSLSALARSFGVSPSTMRRYLDGGLPAQGRRLEMFQKLSRRERYWYQEKPPLGPGRVDVRTGARYQTNEMDIGDFMDRIARLRTEEGLVPSSIHVQFRGWELSNERALLKPPDHVHDVVIHLSQNERDRLKRGDMMVLTNLVRTELNQFMEQECPSDGQELTPLITIVVTGPAWLVRSMGGTVEAQV